MLQPAMSLFALPGLPLIEPGDDLVAIIVDALAAAEVTLQPGDLLVLAQKVVSKAEGRYAYLNDCQPSVRAQELAAQCDKDPRLVELILSESQQVLRVRPGVIIVQHRLGYIHANAGIDRSNIASDDDNPRVLLLPQNPDGSASTLREGLRRRTGVAPAVIINDSAGRAWRNGSLGFAIGCAGMLPVESRIGEGDLFGRPLEITEIAVADELAAAASSLMGQGDEARPVVLIRGASFQHSDHGAATLIRDAALDLFR